MNRKKKGNQYSWIFLSSEKSRCLPKIFFLKGADCWGWATWKRGWDLFNPDGRYLHSKIKNTNREYEFNINGSYDFMKMLTDCINWEK